MRGGFFIKKFFAERERRKKDGFAFSAQNILRGMKYLRKFYEKYGILFYMKPLTKKRDAPKALVLASLALCAATVYLLANVPPLSEYLFARGITRGINLVLSRVVNLLPVSFYELTAEFLIVGGTALAVYLIYLLAKRRFSLFKRYVYKLAVAALSVLVAFGLLYAPLYNRVSVWGALGLGQTEVTAENLYAAAEYYVTELNEVSSRMERDEKGNIVAPYGFEELCGRLNGEYSSCGGYFASYDVRAKAVVLSVPMSYLGITGIFFPFYAEANVNTNIPPYELPVTMAHEMAHAKGVSREDEANLTAYALCISSSDDYLRYSGLMNAAAIALNALPQEQYESLYEKIDAEILTEYKNASEHYKKYEGALDAVSSFFNDLFLKSNGVPSGTKSYSQTTRGLIALYERVVEEK